MLTILIVILLVLAIGGLPTFGFNTAYGYGPSGLLGLIVLILLVLLLVGRI